MTRLGATKGLEYGIQEVLSIAANLKQVGAVSDLQLLTNEYKYDRSNGSVGLAHHSTIEQYSHNKAVGSRGLFLDSRSSNHLSKDNYCLKKGEL